MGVPLDCSAHAAHHQPLVQIEFQQGRAQQDLVTLVGTDQGALRRGHDVVLLGKGLHVLAHLRSLNLRVLENGRHFIKLVLEVQRSVDVHFQGPEEGALPHTALCSVLLGVVVEDDGRSNYHVIFDELVQVFGVKTG